jgi:hypothetical protein
MANDPKNIRLGPCRVYWGGIDLGLTKGGVEVDMNTSTKEVTVDQFGNTPVNEYINGRKLMVKCPFAETDLDTLHALMKSVGSTLTDDGAKATGSITLSVAAPATNDKVTVNGVDFVFKAAPTALTDVQIAATIAETARNLAWALQYSTNPSVTPATYAVDAVMAGKINVTYDMTGTAGNAFTLAKTAINIAVSGATLAGGTVSTKRKVTVTSATGVSLYSSAQELVLHPQDKADNDYSEDFIIPLAANAGALKFSYKLDQERLFDLTFNGYPNTQTNVLFIMGDRR